MLIGSSSAWRFGEKPPELSTEHQLVLYIGSCQVLPIITSIESGWSFNYQFLRKCPAYCIENLKGLNFDFFMFPYLFLSL
jgi:hypothetical protein